MRDKEPFFLIYRQPSGALVSKNKLNRHTFAAPPSRISGTRQMLLSRVIATNNTAVGTEHQPVRPWAVRNQAIEPAGRTHGTPGARIVHSSLPLIGEIDVAVARDMQVVGAPEGLAIAVPQKRADSIPLRISMRPFM